MRSRPGIPGSRLVAFRIRLKNTPEANKFQEFDSLPLRVTGNPLTAQQRTSQGLLSLGSPQVMSTQAGSFMRARCEGPLFDISATELNRVPRQPGYVPVATRAG